MLDLYVKGFSSESDDYKIHTQTNGTVLYPSLMQKVKIGVCTITKLKSRQGDCRILTINNYYGVKAPTLGSALY